MVTGLLPVLLGNVPDGRARQGGHLGVESTVGDLLSHPAFAGFADLILPWDGRTDDERMPLTRIGSLLPNHSHVDAETVASALNPHDRRGGPRPDRLLPLLLRDGEEAGACPRQHGAVLLRGRPGAPFAVVSPGGGFSYVGSVHEGFPHAAAISSKGYNAFVLKYRAGVWSKPSPLATWPRRSPTSIATRRRLASAPAGTPCSGSSAGARMAAAVGSHGVASHGGGDVPKPSAVVMAYTGHSDHVFRLSLRRSSWWVSKTGLPRLPS